MAEANEQIMEMFMSDEQKAQRLKSEAIFKKLFDDLPVRPYPDFLKMKEVEQHG